MEARGRKWLWAVRAALATFSLAASLVCAETAVRLVHRGAFPYLNLFCADAQYGVRLLPSAATRVRSRGGQVTEIATNALGFRGPEWNAAAAPRVLLLGDSQLFGYGVEWRDTAAAILPSLMGGERYEVLDAAVPSWGPLEYVRALAELAPRFRPRYVVFTANAANDWFEAAVPNARRTTARDGWAAAPDGSAAPEGSFWRALFYRRSHLAFALRELRAGVRALGDERLPADGALRLARDLPQLRRGNGRHRSRLTASLLEAARLCRALGCEVIAAALPLDVQVSLDEWTKYRAAPADLIATERLLGDFLADARDAGLRTVDLLAALRDAEPGAFLPDDYHLSARGQRAVAEALARAIDGGTQLAGTP